MPRQTRQRRAGQRKADSGLTPLRRKPSLDFSVTGLVYCSMMMFLGLAAINSQANLLFGVFGLMIGVLLVSGVVSRLVLRRLTLTRVLPDHAVVGVPANVVYQLENAKRYWPSLSVTVAEIDAVDAFVRQPHAYLLHAAARMQAAVPVELVPRRRGLHEFGRYQLSTSFPFGFIKRAVERRRHESLLVYPAIGAVSPALLRLCHSAENAGPTMRPRRGGMDEFYGLKEYRAGETPHWIYWRRSARTGVLVSKEMTRVAPPRLLLLVDTYLSDASLDRREAVERGIAMAASLADRAVVEGLPVGMTAWSGGWITIPPNRGKRHRRDLLTFLARLPANSKYNCQALLAGYKQDKGDTTTVLFSTSAIQPGLAEAVRGMLLTVNPETEQGKHWFTFDPKINFAHCSPMERGESD